MQFYDRYYTAFAISLLFYVLYYSLVILYFIWFLKIIFVFSITIAALHKIWGMKKLWYITIFYSHIEPYKCLCRIHMKSQKRESDFQHRFGCPVTMICPLRNRVCTNPDAVPATQHKPVLSDSLYLVPLFPLGSIRTMFFI